MPRVLNQTNLAVTRHDDIMGRHPADHPWAEVVIEDGRNHAVWISGPPGTPPDPHIHPNFNEWWVALDGRTEWQIGQYEPVVAEWGDIIMAPAGFCHAIQPYGEEQAIRFGITHPESNHNIKGIAPCRFIPVETGPGPNLVHTPLKRLLKQHGASSNWKELVVLDERNRALLTHELPGTANRRMWHPEMHKWWVVLGGELEWSIGEAEPVVAGAGDVVFVPAETEHEIRTVSAIPSIRLTITAPDIVHYYANEDGGPA